jgi:hypothetical protein
MKHKKKLIKSAKARVTGTIPYCLGLWDGGRHTSLRAKTNFILISSRHLFVHFVLPFSIKGFIAINSLPL